MAAATPTMPISPKQLIPIGLMMSSGFVRNPSIRFAACDHTDYVGGIITGERHEGDSHGGNGFGHCSFPLVALQTSYNAGPLLTQITPGWWICEFPLSTRTTNDTSAPPSAALPARAAQPAGAATTRHATGIADA
jgi:hypothetical protein